MPPRRLKIAMLSAHSCPVGNLGEKDTGGMSVYIRELSRELGRQGHLVDIYTRVHDPDDRQVYEIGQNARLIHLRAGEVEKIHKLAVYPYLPDFSCNLENFRKQDGTEYDLIFSHYWLSGMVGEYLQQWWGVPHLIMFHTLGAVKNRIGIGEEEPELRIEMERELAGSCHHIIAATEKEKEAIVRYYGASPEKVSIVPCGVNLELFRPVDKEEARKQLGFTDDKIILFVGRIEPLKGIEQLLKAIPQLQNGRRHRLVIIGGDEHSRGELEGLRELSRQLDIEDSVTFLGSRKQEQIPSLYSAADVCAIPSYYESFGLVALESLACGTPVVATDVGALRSVIREGETGYVVIDNDPRQLADKIGRLLEKPQNTTSILSIRESVSRFSWENTARKVMEECRAVLADYAAPSLA